MTHGRGSVTVTIRLGASRTVTVVIVLLRYSLTLVTRPLATQVLLDGWSQTIVQPSR